MSKQDKDYCYAKVIIKAFIAYEKNTSRKCRLIDECSKNKIRLYIHHVNRFLQKKYKNSSKQIKFTIYKQKTQPWIILYTSNVNNDSSDNIKEEDPNKRIINDMCASCMLDWLSMMNNEGKEIEQLKTMLWNSKYSSNYTNIVKKQMKGGDNMLTKNNHDTVGKEVNNTSMIGRVTHKVAAITGQEPTLKLKNLIVSLLNKQTVVDRIEDDIVEEVVKEIETCYTKLGIGAVIVYERDTQRIYNLLNSDCDKNQIAKGIDIVNEYFKKKYPNSRKKIAFTINSTKTHTRIKIYTTNSNNDDDDDMGGMMPQPRSVVSTTRTSSSSKNKEEEEKEKEFIKQNQKIIQDLIDLALINWLFEIEDDEEIKELRKIAQQQQRRQEQEQEQEEL